MQKIELRSLLSSLESRCLKINKKKKDLDLVLFKSVATFLK